MNKDLELSILRKASKKYGDALRTIRQDAHDSWGTSGPHNALKRIEKAAAHALDYTTMPDSSQQHKPESP